MVAVSSHVVPTTKRRREEAKSTRSKVVIISTRITRSKVVTKGTRIKKKPRHFVDD